MRRPVVTAIVQREGDGKLLLVKRSDQVGTYQQHWGGVSGGVEGDESLLHRALQELGEEVGLLPAQLRLLAAGRPLPVDDGHRHFLVFPFLFRLADPAAAVTLNWENVDHAWVAASDVPQLQHVPLLPETLRRLLLPPYMAQHVSFLQQDRAHGAAELAAYVLRAVRAAVSHEASGQAPPDAATFEGCLEAYRNFCFHMATARPDMAAVANTAVGVLLQLEAELEARADPFEPSASVARAALADAVDRLQAQQQREQATAVANTAAVLHGGMCVLTTSLSSTVANALIEAHTAALAAAAPAGSTRPTPQAAAAAGGGGAGGSAAGAVDRRTQHEPPVDVDDPRFWPRISGVGREVLGGDAAAGDAVRSGREWLLARLTPGSSSSSSSDASGGSAGALSPPAAGPPLRFKGSSSGPGLAVIVCEARPLCEGVTMARTLSDAGLAVTLITDAQAGVFVEQADVVLLGADAVTPHGVVNKAGSRLLALAASAAGVPVVAATTASKVAPGPVTSVALPNTHELQAGHEEKDAGELLAAWGSEAAAAVSARSRSAAAAGEQQPGAGSARSGDSSGGSIAVRNVYFEAVPLPLVTAIVTDRQVDRGVLGPQQVAALLSRRVREYQRAFGLPSVAGADADAAAVGAIGTV